MIHGHEHEHGHEHGHGHGHVPKYCRTSSSTSVRPLSLPLLGGPRVILRLLNRVNVSVLDLGGWLGKSRTVLLLTLIDDGPIRL